MPRRIKRITTIIYECDECPNFAHSGSFTAGGALPLCMKTRAPSSQFDEYPQYSGKHRILKTIKDGIPEWCPL